MIRKKNQRNRRIVALENLRKSKTMVQNSLQKYKDVGLLGKEVGGVVMDQKYFDSKITRINKEIKILEERLK
jgi:hypothetical protein